MIQPFLHYHGAGSQPSSIQAGSYMPMAVTVSVAMAVVGHLGGGGGIKEEVAVERLAAAQTHEESSAEQHARDTQRSQALDLAETGRIAVGRRSQTPGNRCKSQYVRGQVRHAVPRIGNHGLRVEHVTSDALGEGHAQVGVEANSSDAHAGIILVLRGEIDIVMVVVM